MSRPWRKKLPKLLEKSGGVCHYCRRKIYAFASIKKQFPDAKLEGSSQIRWVEDGKTKIGYLATVDHLTMRREGGTNDESNLVAACKKCNKWRSDLPRKPR